MAESPPGGHGGESPRWTAGVMRLGAAAAHSLSRRTRSSSRTKTVPGGENPRLGSTSVLLLPTPPPPAPLCPRDLAPQGELFCKKSAHHRPLALAPYFLPQAWPRPLDRSQEIKRRARIYSRAYPAPHPMTVIFRAPGGSAGPSPGWRMNDGHRTTG